jgi:hypothetical protein
MIENFTITFPNRYLLRIWIKVIILLLILIYFLVYYHLLKNKK